MKWTVVVPFKAAAERKSRLAPAYSAAERLALSDALYRHVVRSIADASLSDGVILLSPAQLDPDPPVRLWLQEDVSLNVELARVREAVAGPMMVVNADLPLLGVEDLVVLADAAEGQGAAIAPDRHGAGTNAVAVLPDAPFAFVFGPDSLRLHRESAMGRAALVQRPGLAYDVDTLDDIAAISALRQELAPDVARLLRLPVDKGTHASLAAGD